MSREVEELALLRKIAQAGLEWWVDRVPKDPTEDALMMALAEWDRWRRGATVEDDIGLWREFLREDGKGDEV